MPNNDAIPMNVVEVLASAELNVNDNSESVAMSVAEGGAGSSGKADKVSGATAGDLAGLDATGNLTDSGKKPADFVAAENFYATQLPMSSTDPTTVAQTATELKSALDLKADIIHDTVSNVAIASVPDGAANLPLTALRFAVEPIQSGSGDPSPTNVRPITGRTGAVVTGTGVNAWDEQWEVGNISTTTGQNDGTTSYLRSKNYIPIKPGTDYYIKSPNNGRIFYYGRDYTYIGYESISNNAVNTTNANAYYARFRIASTYGTTYNNDISINYPSTDTAYHAYTGSQHTVQFGQTVFGGVVDWVNGVLVVDRAMVDMGDLTWNNVTQYGYMLAQTPDAVSYAAGQMPSILCELYKTTAAKTAQDWATAEDKTIGTRATYSNIIVKDTDYTDRDIFKTAVTGYKVVYLIATPIEIPLSELDEIRTVKGINNVWSDSGDIVELTYACDTKGYIDKKLAELTALVLET